MIRGPVKKGDWFKIDLSRLDQTADVAKDPAMTSGRPVVAIQDHEEGAWVNVQVPGHGSWFVDPDTLDRTAAPDVPLTMKIRFPLAVAENRSWTVFGSSLTEPEPAAEQAHADLLNLLDITHMNRRMAGYNPDLNKLECRLIWVEVEVPVPTTTVVQGQVVE